MRKNSKLGYKAIVVFMLTISMLLSLSACGKEEVSKSESSKETSVEDSSVKDSSDDKKTEKNYSSEWTIDDSKLFGAWMCVSVDNPGDFAPGIMYGYDAELYIMHDGQCYGSIFESIYRLEGEGDWLNPICSLEAKKGELTFKDVSYKGEGTLELKVEYTIGDVEKSSISEDDDLNNFYRNEKDDQLTLHFTGTNKIGPTDIQTVDFTLVYEKNGFADDKSEGVLWASMVGDWEDNYGNKWTFTPRKESGDLGFVVTSDGKEYEGETDEAVRIGVYTSADEEFDFHLMNFFYADDDMSNIEDARVISYDGSELVLEQEDGQSLIFKR